MNRMSQSVVAIVIALVSVVVSVPIAVQAGPGSTGGGGGYSIGGKPFVADLVVAGVEREPFLDPAVGENLEYSKRIRAAFTDPELAKDLPVIEISRKLNEINLYIDHKLPIEILKAMKLFSWQKQNFDLIRVDRPTPVVKLSRRLEIQLATRSEGVVKINAVYWHKMSAANRAALVLHEIIYALTESQSADDAIRIVGYMFTADFKAKGRKGFTTIVNSQLNLSQSFYDKQIVFDCPSQKYSKICDGIESDELFFEVDMGDVDLIGANRDLGRPEISYDGYAVQKGGFLLAALTDPKKYADESCRYLLSAALESVAKYLPPQFELKLMALFESRTVIGFDDTRTFIIVKDQWFDDDIGGMLPRQIIEVSGARVDLKDSAFMTSCQSLVERSISVLNERLKR